MSTIPLSTILQVAGIGGITPAITIDASNRVGIRKSPTFDFEVETTNSAAFVNTNNVGIRLTPEITGATSHGVVSFSNVSNDFHNLILAGANINLLTGTGTASSRFFINNLGAISVNATTPQPATFNGTVTATQFNGPGCDWFFLGQLSPDGSTQAIDFSLASGYSHFALVLQNINFSTDTIPVFQLRDSTSVIGSNLYSSAVLGWRTGSTGLSLSRQTNQLFWFGTAFNVTQNSVSGSLSGIYYFFNPTSTQRWKRFTSQTSQYFFDGSVINEAGCQGVGSVDSTTAATIIRIIAGSGNIAAGGTIRLYGIR